MKITYLLEGLDCANCAAKIETAVSKLDGVSSASVSFMTTKMIIECDDDKAKETEKKALKAVRRQDPDISPRKV